MVKVDVNVLRVVMVVRRWQTKGIVLLAKYELLALLST
jgi:hypothetical protein